MNRGLRIADCRLRVCTVVLVHWLTFFALATNELVILDEIPPLQPPKAEMLPGFWEQHGLLISLAVLTCLIALVVLWRVLSRPKPPVIPAPGTIARRLLQPLRERSEDKELLTEVSSILRHYFIAAFALPNEEFTNHELCRQLEGHPKVDAKLATAASTLLQGMDHHRFNVESPPQSSAGVSPVSRSEETNPAITNPGESAAPAGTAVEIIQGQAGRPSCVSTVESALRLIDQAEAKLHPPPAETSPANPNA